jgi:hypothetical protein
MGYVDRRKLYHIFTSAIENCTLLSLDHLRPPKIKLLSAIFLHRAPNLILERSEIGKFLTPARPAYSRAPEPLTHDRLRSCLPSTARRHRLLPDAGAFPPQAGAAAHAWIRSYGSMNGKSSYIIFFHKHIYNDMLLIATCRNLRPVLYLNPLSCFASC